MTLLDHAKTVLLEWESHPDGRVSNEGLRRLKEAVLAEEQLMREHEAAMGRKK